MSGKDETKKGGGVVTPFRKDGRESGAPEGRDQADMPTPKGHVVTAYLDMLVEEGFVSSVEHERLVAAFAGLTEQFSTIKSAAVDAVRKEMGRPENNKYVLKDKEEVFWRAALKKGKEPIPGFRIDEVRSHFLVTPETDPDKTVVFLRPEYQTRIRPYVPPSLRMGEVFFYVVLRMFRTHVQKSRR